MALPAAFKLRLTPLPEFATTVRMATAINATTSAYSMAATPATLAARRWSEPRTTPERLLPQRTSRVDGVARQRRETPGFWFLFTDHD
jgi:hypothetical protein